MLRIAQFSRRHAAVLGCTVALLSGGALISSAAAELQAVRRLSGPLVRHRRNPGQGRQQAHNRTRSLQSELPRQRRTTWSAFELGCKGDNYKFSLTGNFEADASNQVTGRWNEENHNIGGTAIGRAQGGRLQVHAESSAFSAELNMVTRSRRQSVSLDSRGAGKRMTASITLRHD